MGNQGSYVYEQYVYWYRFRRETNIHTGTDFDEKITPEFSNELAFKMAGIFAVKEACKKANLVLLEPIMKVEVVTPEVSQGDVMGDLNRRRGKILGMEMDSKQICTLTCEVPLAEMFGYATAVRSLSKGRASYSMEPFSFEQVPGNIAEEVISGSTKKPART